MYRDPGGFYVYLVAVRLTVASLPYSPPLGSHLFLG
jgi:hypothetical protein